MTELIAFLSLLWGFLPFMLAIFIGSAVFVCGAFAIVFRSELKEFIASYQNSKKNEQQSE